MSPAEVAWRAGAGVRARILDVRGGAEPLPRWTDERWLGLLLQLTESRRDPLVADAARIAGGELALWGRRVDVDPRRPEWHADPLGGESWGGGSWRASGRDPKPVWELHRQQHLFPLAAGAALAGRGDWAELCIAQALDWSGRNPPRTGIAWVSAYEAAHRLVSWAFAIPLVADVASPAQLAGLSATFAEHRRFVAARPSRYSSANNHRLAELAGLLAASLLTPDTPGWDPLWAELEHEAARQTYADGGSCEQAAGYFLYALEILWVAGLLARGAGRDLEGLAERLRAMLEWLAAVADGDGEPPPLGDDAEDRFLRPDYFEPRRAAALAGRVETLLDGSPAFDGPVPAPSTPSVLLRESGLALLRAGEIRVVFDVGELGLGALAAHGHADALAVLADGPHGVLVRDSGTGSYAEALGRNDHRSTAFHNTVVVDGESQAEALGPHLWGRRFAVRVEAAAIGGDWDYVRASHDGYLSRPAGALHTRSLLLVGPGLLVVLDRIRARRPCRADLVWQPGPAAPDGPAVVSDPPVRGERLRGRFSPRYTREEDAVRLVWPARGTDIVFASALSLDDPAASLELSLERRGELCVFEAGDVQIVEDWSSPRPEVRV